MADKNGRERLGLYFSIKNNPKEKEMWDYLCTKFSKQAFVKEAIAEKILREKAGISIAPSTSTKVDIQQDVKKEEKKDKVKLNKNDTNSLGEFASM